MTAKVGFIGVGNMGSAILRGLAGRGDVTLYAVDASPGRVAQLTTELGVKEAATSVDLAAACDYIILGVKPQQMESVLDDIRPAMNPGTCLVSIAAGITLARLKGASGGACPVVRVMPNTPALVGAGVFALCFEDPAVSEAQRLFVTSLFAPIGQVHVLAERLFDAFTAVVGCGPAYVFYVMDALVEAGVAVGLSRDQSSGMVKALFEGSAKLASQSDKHLVELREMVTSPGGSTVEGTNLLDRQAVRGSLIDAVKAAYLRNIELGRK